MEKALLDGEWQAQKDKLLQEEERLSLLKSKVAQLDKDIEHYRATEAERLSECKRQLEAAERESQR